MPMPMPCLGQLDMDAWHSFCDKERVVLFFHPLCGLLLVLVLVLVPFVLFPLSFSFVPVSLYPCFPFVPVPLSILPSLLSLSFFILYHLSLFTQSSLPPFLPSFLPSFPYSPFPPSFDSIHSSAIFLLLAHLPFFSFTLTHLLTH